MRILLHGAFHHQCYENSWRLWLEAHGHEVCVFDHGTVLKNFFVSRLLERIFWRFFQTRMAAIVSGAFRDLAVEFSPDLVLIVSGRLINRDALETIRRDTRAVLFHFYGEDFFNPLNTTATLKKAIGCYDHLFTTKRCNVDEMELIGFNNITFIPHGYIPDCHYPVAVTEEDRARFGSDLSFIGTFEEARAATMRELTEFDLKIWGSGWNKARRMERLRSTIQREVVYCESMSKVINCSRISLSFLRKANRDLHTQRTFEIPICGGFQLSERTDEVLAFFEEGKEIECFDSIGELKEKARFYLQNEKERHRIAKAGLDRARASSYSYTDRLQEVLEHYENFFAR